MSDEQIIMSKGDITVVELPYDECESCGNMAMHAVMIDFRVVGTSVRLGLYCEECAIDVAERLQATIADFNHDQ